MVLYGTKYLTKWILVAPQRGAHEDDAVDDEKEEGEENTAALRLEPLSRGLLAPVAGDLL